MRALFLLFLVVPLVELYLLIFVGRHIGAWPTIGATVAISAIGAALARREGLRVLRQTQQAVAEGRMPEEGMVSGLLILAAGLLLLTPGLISDAVGLALLVPPIRRVAARGVRRWLEKRVMGAGGVQIIRGPWPDPGAHDDDDVIDIDPGNPPQSHR